MPQPSAPFYWHDLNSILARISNYTHHKVGYEINYVFPNFWIRSFLPHFSGYVIIYPRRD